MNRIGLSPGDIRDRINTAVKMAGGIGKLARIAGVSARTVYAWKRGDRSPTLAMYAKLSTWLEEFDAKQRREGGFGDGVVREEPKGYGRSAVECDTFSLGHVAVPFHGDDAPTSPLLLPWGSPLYGDRPPDGLRFVRMKGRSMEPVLRHNDLCLMDTQDVALEEDGIYLVRHGEERYIRRCCPTPGGACRFMGDNRSLPQLDFSLREEELGCSWGIDGRIFWFGRSL